MEIQLRESIENDFEFVFSLNKVNMKKYVNEIRGWNDEVEREEMKGKFTPGIDKIVQCDGKDIGVLRVLESENEIRLDHIELLPEYQSQGIGSKLLNELTMRAESEQKTVKLSVLKDNPARKLYERSGFEQTGKNELKILMEKRPRRTR